jgi:hypothetical protein
VFGSTAYVHVPENQRRKLDPKARKMIFVGYDWKTTKLYRVYGLASSTSSEKRPTKELQDWRQVEDHDPRKPSGQRPLSNESQNAFSILLFFLFLRTASRVWIIRTCVAEMSFNRDEYD